MTAESLTSLFFYIVMVAAIAGVGAMVMSKTAGAKGAAALSIARANVTGMGNLMDYTIASTLPVDQATHMIADAAGVIPGVGTMEFVARPAAASVEVGIVVSDIENPDVCRAVGSVGFGTWTGVAAAATPSVVNLSNYSIPGTAATATAAGVITAGAVSTKSTLETVCANIGGVNKAALLFVTK